MDLWDRRLEHWLLNLSNCDFGLARVEALTAQSFWVSVGLRPNFIGPYPGIPVGDLFPPGASLCGAGGRQGQQALPPDSSHFFVVPNVKIWVPKSIKVSTQIARPNPPKSNIGFFGPLFAPENGNSDCKNWFPEVNCWLLQVRNGAAGIAWIALNPKFDCPKSIIAVCGFRR